MNKKMDSVEYADEIIERVNSLLPKCPSEKYYETLSTTLENVTKLRFQYIQIEKQLQDKEFDGLDENIVRKQLTVVDDALSSALLVVRQYCDVLEKQ